MKIHNNPKVKNSYDELKKEQMIAMGERIRSERKRIGLTQEQLATEGDVTQRAQTGYERAESSPNALYLQGVEKVGVDIQYIITGKHKVDTDAALKTYGEIFKILDETLQAKNLNLPAQRKVDATKVIYKEYCANGMNIQSMVNVLAESA